jgi:hypothetical protein
MTMCQEKIDLSPPRECACNRSEARPHIHVRRSQLNSAEYMRQNQTRVGQAANAKSLVIEES